MKIIGIILTWNNLEFFKCALDQALEFCDEVHLAEGGHSKWYPRRSTDGTCQYIKKMANHPKLRIFKVDYRRFRGHKKYHIVQWKIRQEILKSSEHFKPGSWIFHFDDDRFFFDDDMKKLRAVMEDSQHDCVAFRERRFFFNFRFNVIPEKRIVLGPYRITEGCFWEPIAKMKYADGALYIKNHKRRYQPDICVYHYVYVKKAARIRARFGMSLEKGPRFNDKTKASKLIALNWKKDRGIFVHKKMVESIVGGRNLNIYDGLHPEVLQDHPWLHEDDVRRLK